MYELRDYCVSSHTKHFYPLVVLEPLESSVVFFFPTQEFARETGAPSGICTNTAGSPLLIVFSTSKRGLFRQVRKLGHPKRAAFKR